MNAPGFRFKEGKLFLFDQKSVAVIESWPSLKAMQKIGSSGWQEFRPIFPLLSPIAVEPEFDPGLLQQESFQMAYQRRAAFRAFRSFIPEAMAKACEEIPGRQLTMLMLMQASPAAAELAQSNRALVFALSHPHFFRERFSTLQGAAIVVKRRQREIAAWLGFPETDSAVRTLSKLAGASIFKESLRVLRSSMVASNGQKILSHLPRINAGVLGFVAEEELCGIVPMPLLMEVAENRDEDMQAQTAHVWEHCVTMARELGESLRRPSSIQKLDEWYQEIWERWVEKNPPLPKTFPPPPLGEIPTIQPILDEAGLIEEGKQQSNCVGFYGDRVRSGSVLIYRVLAPERATLSLVMGQGGQWVIGQLKLSSNQPCSELTKKHVTDWLENRAIQL
jgi:hypothetical protein